MSQKAKVKCNWRFHANRQLFVYKKLYKARRFSPTLKNIIAGLKASGLWPVSMEKTHENTMMTKFEGPPVMPLKAMTALPATTQSLFFFYVPKSSIQLKSALKKSFFAQNQPTIFNFFKTQTGKPLDTQPMVIVALDQEVPSRWYKKEKITAQKKIIWCHLTQLRPPP